MSDNQYLQSLLDKCGCITFPPINPADGGNIYNISEPLVIRSGCDLTLDGCVLRLCDGVYSNIFISEGAWEKTPAPTENISIRAVNGAILSGGKHNGLTERTANRDGRPSVLHNTLLLFRNVHGFRLSGLKIYDPRYWGMTFYYCSDGEIRDTEFRAANDAPNQDGIDLRRGCHDIIIDGVTGSTGDDTVALTALMHSLEERLEFDGASPDVYNVSISNVSTEVTGGHGIVRLLCHDGIKMHSIRIANIYDRLIDTKRTKCQAAIRIQDANYWTLSPARNGDMYDITIDGVTTNAPIAVKLHGDIPELRLRNIATVE